MKNTYSVLREQELDVSELITKTYTYFLLSLLVSAIGVYFGLKMVPTLMQTGVFIVMVVVWFALMFAIQSARKSKSISKSLALFYAFAFVGGLFLAPTIFTYAKMSGPWLIWKALIVTGGLFMGLTIYAFSAKKMGKDFSYWDGWLFASLWGLLIVMFISLFVRSTMLDTLISCAVVIIFSAAIMYDTHRLIDNKRYDEAPLIALSLYLDFVNLFLHVLRLFGIKATKD